MTLCVCTLGGRGWMVVRTEKSKKIRKIPPAAEKKRNKLRNYDLVIRMYPGWAGVDGGTKKRKSKYYYSSALCHIATLVFL